MRAGGSKQKGAGFEREICKKLSLGITGGKQDDVFWRSAMSGGRATIAHRKGQDIRQSGDITSVAPEGHVFTDRWFVECKHYKQLDLLSFFIKNRGITAQFWRHAKKQAKNHKKEPMLILKQNNLPILVIAIGQPELWTPLLYSKFIPPIILSEDYGYGVWLFDMLTKTI